MIYFISESVGNEKHAGSKARRDLESLFLAKQYQPIEIPAVSQKATKHMFLLMVRQRKKYHLMKHAFSSIAPNSVLLIQYPCVELSLFWFRSIKELHRRGISVVLLVHDLDGIRFSARKDVKEKEVLYLETLQFAKADFGIVHNSRMKQYLVAKGISEAKLVELGIFDYLISPYEPLRIAERMIGRTLPIVIAGNLSSGKASYVYHLPEGIAFNLYGVNYDGSQTTANVHFKGAFEPDELPYVLSGSFGLVWDGDSIDCCSGGWGAYLRYNNPHKTSLYLASGLPVIIWKEAALATFVLDNKCGLVVDSLPQLAGLIASLSDAEYEALRRNADLVGKRLRGGYYTYHAINSCLAAHHETARS
ncbi:MAG: hypothetical protein LKE39_05500 [Sphaerochaeta sp.]|jgi:hypothetical protein|nr:hypothetical protein [Sphaerochaeta sp.]MCI2128137.1 hypothetical protein [Sphaerochaeta sp.]